jgi:trimethylamine--corrinoid protein Co-methyltransferase
MTVAYIVLVQLMNPGAPVLAISTSTPMHWAGGHPLVGSTIEIPLMTACYHQIYREHDIPTGSGAGYASESKIVDYQCGFEKALGALSCALAGSNLHILHGGFATELGFHNMLQVMDDEIAAWVVRYLQGFEMTKETLAMDLISEIGVGEDTYMDKEHSLNHWMTDRLIPKVSDLDSYEDWKKKGKSNIVLHSEEKVQEILETHKPKPLTSGEEQIISDIMKEAREYYRKQGEISEEEWKVYMKTLEANNAL